MDFYVARSGESPQTNMQTRVTYVTPSSLSPWTVRELAGKGRLPCVRITRKLLFDLRDLDALIDREKA